MNEETIQIPILPFNAQADELLEKSQVAARLRVSRRTIDTWMQQRRIPYFKIGKTVRFRWGDILRHLDAHAGVR